MGTARPPGEREKDKPAAARAKAKPGRVRRKEERRGADSERPKTARAANVCS